MPAVWARAGSELRGRLWAWVGIAVLVGLTGGVVIAAAAGARRTDSAYRGSSPRTPPPTLSSATMWSICPTGPTWMRWLACRRSLASLGPGSCSSPGSCRARR